MFSLYIGVSRARDTLWCTSSRARAAAAAALKGWIKQELTALLKLCIPVVSQCCVLFPGYPHVRNPKMMQLNQWYNTVLPHNADLDSDFPELNVLCCISVRGTHYWEILGTGFSRYILLLWYLKLYCRHAETYFNCISFFLFLCRNDCHTALALSVSSMSFDWYC